MERTLTGSFVQGAPFFSCYVPCCVGGKLFQAELHEHTQAHRSAVYHHPFSSRPLEHNPITTARSGAHDVALSLRPETPRLSTRSAAYVHHTVDHHVRDWGHQLLDLCRGLNAARRTRGRHRAHTRRRGGRALCRRAWEALEQRAEAQELPIDQ
eukprot:CAMPEP_0195571694 /NCGR_PEP_ID=MMETSP0814-20130614/4254_1 /TAXON_ID=97485 /ORGANISM="Prymnesium parvum, Strain Texoma1" /LENGTH=153 /DNA_ID=CAMNT_0040707353 /DNA_START=312 /DNA_END=773 /DNA_ORIENTATION=+